MTFALPMMTAGVLMFLSNSVAVHAQTTTGGASLNGLNPQLISPNLPVSPSNNQITLPAGAQANPAGAQTGATGQTANTGPQGQSPLPGQQGQGIAGQGIIPLPRPGSSVVSVPPQADNQQAVVGLRTTQGVGGRTSDLTPFEPLGVRVRKFILRPSIEVVGGYSSNSTEDVSGTGSAFVNVDGEINLESDFARHAINAQVGGGISRFASGSDASDFDIRISASGRFDIDDDTALTPQIAIIVQEDDLTGVADDPLETTATASLQFDHVIGAVDTSSQVRLSRNINGDFTDAAGIEQNQDDLNSNLFGVNTRFTFRRGGVINPFVEADISREVFDEETDVLGNNRNVTGLRGLVGVEIDRGDKFNGDVAFGFGQNFVGDDGIEDFGAFLAEFTLNWSPRRSTTITLNGQTTLDAFPSIATPGDTTYNFNLAVSRDVRENLTATAGAGLIFQVDGGDLGTDTTIEASLGLEYGLTRNLALGLVYDFARQLTADGGADFTANTISLGLRAER